MFLLQRIRVLCRDARPPFDPKYVPLMLRLVHTALPSSFRPRTARRLRSQARYPMHVEEASREASHSIKAKGDPRSRLSPEYFLDKKPKGYEFLLAASSQLRQRSSQTILLEFAASFAIWHVFMLFVIMIVCLFWPYFCCFCLMVCG